MLKHVNWPVVTAFTGAVFPILAAAWLSHQSALHILDANERINLQRTFDEVTTDYYVMSKIAWLDVIERGYPQRDSAGLEQKSERQIEFETKSHARYRLLETLLKSRCPDSTEMRRRAADLRCANYRVFALYDATEDGAATVRSEAEKDGERLRTMSASCAGIDSLLRLKTSRTERSPDDLRKHFAKEHRALLDAMAAVREELQESCD